MQFFCHEYFTLFGASEKKLRGYNECFKDTIHFFPADAARVVPDLYPILLHLLIVVNRTLSVLFLIRGCAEKRRKTGFSPTATAG